MKSGGKRFRFLFTACLIVLGLNLVKFGKVCIQHDSRALIFPINLLIGFFAYQVVAFKFFEALKISLLLICPINTPFSTTGNRLTGLLRNSFAAATISQVDSIVFTLAVM
jgi:hypothetical protein